MKAWTLETTRGVRAAHLTLALRLVAEHSRSRVDLACRAHLIWPHPQVPSTERSLGIPRLRGGRRFAPAQGLTDELDAVGPLQQPVQHGVRDRGVANTSEAWAKTAPPSDISVPKMTA